MENTNVISGPVTTGVVNSQSPDLLLSEIDRRIVRIRPMSTPIDQISRHAEARHAGSMTVEYYAVDAKPFATKLTEAVPEATATRVGEPLEFTVKVAKPEIFEVSDTVMFPKVIAGSTVTAYVTATGKDFLSLRSTLVNAAGVAFIPAIEVGNEIVRMGRAAGELDVQTPQFQALPTKKSNFCQIFKSQVEVSTLVKLANKEAGWTLTDQEEAAIIDMRQGMERNFLFGNRMRLKLNGDDEVLLTGGIWSQAGGEMIYSDGSLDNDTMISICRKAFSGSTGSSRKLLIGGTGFIEQLHRLDVNRTMSADDKITRWGLDFTEYVSKFGTLYILSSETFDQCGHASDALIVDPEYITKYSHIPMSTEKLDLRSSGQRNTDAVVITEASCLVLRYPSAHLRVVAL